MLPLQSQLELPAGGQAADRLNVAIRQEATSLFTQHGALWVKNAIPADLVGRLHDAFVQRYATLEKAKLRKRHAAVGEGRFMITVRVKPPFNAPVLFANPVLVPILTDLLGPGFVIASFGSVIAFAGADQQPVHCDYPPLFECEELCASLPPYAVTLVVPLVNLDESTGSTAIWEGSHNRVGARAQLKQLSSEPCWDQARLPLAKAGDIYLMDYRTIHAGTANHSDLDRPILYIVYSRPWFREGLNFYEQPPLVISKKQFQRVPEELRYLFAYAKV